MQKIYKKDIHCLLKQLGALLGAGIGLMDALIFTLDGTSKKSLCILIGNIKQDVQNGLSFSQSLSKYPHYFNSLLIGCIQIGEKSGTLSSMLNQLIAYYEQQLQQNAVLKKALTYPCILIAITSITLCILLTVVVPQFATLFTTLHATLPWSTQCLLHITHFMLHKAPSLLIIFSTISVLFAKLAAHKLPQLYNSIFSLQLKIPIIGPLLIKIISARFAATLNIILNAGVPLQIGIGYITHNTKNTILATIINQIYIKITNGNLLSEAMQQHVFFPKSMIQMIRIGEQSTNLPNMLLQIAKLYEQESNSTIQLITQLIEPFSLLILGGIMAGIITSIYLPIFQIGGLF